MLKKLKKSNKGFTIIEVMIVLAIAALILLIVLLAVPALQRNSRNTAIKSDAAAVAGGVSEFASNNSGAIPARAQSSYVAGSGNVSLNNSGGSEVIAKVQPSDSVTFRVDGSTTSVSPALGRLYITFRTGCPATITGTATGTLTAISRSTTVVYAIEIASGRAAKCLEA